MNILKKFRGLINEAIERGGLTVGLGKNDYLKVKEFKSGYMVGGYSEEYRAAIDDIHSMNIAGLYLILLDLHKQAAQAAGFSQYEYTSGLYLGFWVDNGYLYIEISKKFRSKEAALIEASERKQLAIYDCKNNKSIYLK